MDTVDRIEQLKDKMRKLRNIQLRRIMEGNSEATDSILVLSYKECLQLLEYLGNDVEDLKWKP